MPPYDDCLFLIMFRMSSADFLPDSALADAVAGAGASATGSAGAGAGVSTTGATLSFAGSDTAGAG